MASQLNASLLRLKLLDALRGGDASRVDGIITDLSSTKATVQTQDLVQLKETVLHYAVQVAPLATLQHLVGESLKFGLDINAQDMEGNTPLHLAAASSRYEIVKYLLSLPNINDTVVNIKKKQPVELCKDLNTAQLMQFERAKFVEKLAGDLRRFFSARDFENLEALLVSNPRASELLDINGADPETGNTVLHEFIKKDDIQMCDWILKHGGDPFKRDKRGKLPIDLIHNKSDPLRKLLKAASKNQNIMDPIINTNNAIKTGGAPTYKGYLRKWTNFASGYKLRYFVLDQFGILSYYSNQDDTNNACRGSLNLGFASLHLDSSEKLKFEIIGKNGIRWHLKANHPIETNRWVWTLQNAITIAKDNIKNVKLPDSPDPDDENGSSPPISRSSTRTSIDEESKKSKLLSLPRRKHKKSNSQYSINSDAEDVPSESLSRSNTFSRKSTSSNLAKIQESDKGFVENPHSEDFDYDLDGYESDNESTYQKNTEDNGQLNEQVASAKRAIDVEITSLLDLFTLVAKSNDSNSEVYPVAQKTLKGIQDLCTKYNRLISQRETKHLQQLERQAEVNKLWEQSIKQLEAEIAKREDTLAKYEGKKKQLKKYLASNALSGASTPHGSSKDIAAGTLPEDPKESTDKEEHVSASLQNEQVLQNIFEDDSEDEFFDADEFDEEEEEEEEARDEPAVVEQPPTETDSEVTQVEEPKVEEPKEKSSAVSEAQVAHKKMLDEQGSFLGYENPPRKKLGMDEDNRPKVGLWGILKSMIGKDMTRMTLPVSFNEGTSLLQRLAEDIEYNDLLDTAAGFDDSTLRMVYVAAFAASEYASTIDRIAKPFNPLLGETFEYSRPDLNYRLITEQVSHHPPISACHAEAVKWDYYGENAVDSKFRGRSFDFKHLGKMFCTIRPDNGVINLKGERVDLETYSWKKVNTSVVGIIMGNPTVDNFGEMEVTNHTTGDVVVVDLKQRGWKASSAYQLSGHVVDKKKNMHWAIGGHWNSKIYAKKVTASDANRRDSLVDYSELTHSKESSDPYSGRKFLVWQAAPRPKVPFNLTAFAVTLNGIDDKLKPWLPPSDTRLRPDQRAMEDGRYDEASDEKHRVEQKQRAARKEREINGKTYEPNWFVKKKHPVTGDAYWEFQGEYWVKRRDHQLEGCADIF